ncbi:putative FBD-associated F-box protein At5g56690 [Lolium rigidum]|uniref:putative FBD-associated F-box protein At5g56690 n=1 Tax=Lolium rigidum TaxID=89674 RepID=UPI001F5DAA36|nr:putative FBD-associated F-box protein At5g56690 [Lolium rigidum]XP_047091233.1 putative FBD-associated F-box protein At5g56690 [Lolium rigidum]
MESTCNTIRDENTIIVSNDEDIISTLPNDVLLRILECLDMRKAIQTGVLSTRWMHLPHQLSYLQISITHFQGTRSTVDQMMTAYTDAIWRLLSPPTCECSRIIKSLKLSFYLVDPYLSSIAHTVREAVNISVTEYLEFALYGHVQRPSEADLALFRQRFMAFFHACPGAFNLLTKLTLQNLSFKDSDVPNILNTCHKLKYLSLRSCELGQDPVLEIDAPSSELTALQLISFGCAQVELICVPKLAELFYDTWYGENPPVSFGYVPQLVKVCFASPALSWQKPFALSECFSSNRNLSFLHLDFRAQMIWIHPEDPQQLTPLFSKLRVVHLYNIFAECDLNWTMFILEGAPSLEDLCLSRHSCELNKTEKTAEKTNVSWEPPSDNLKRLKLKLLVMIGFEEEEKVMNYIRLVMARAVVLNRIELRDKHPCKGCNAIKTEPPRFPVDEASKHRIREQLIHGSSSSAVIVIG